MLKKCMLKKRSQILCGILFPLGLLTPGANAAETQCYEYDVHGRLVKVVRSGPDNSCTATSDNIETEYAYDDAGNRIEEETTGAPP